MLRCPLLYVFVFLYLKETLQAFYRWRNSCLIFSQFYKYFILENLYIIYHPCYFVSFKFITAIIDWPRIRNLVASSVRLILDVSSLILVGVSYIDSFWLTLLNFGVLGFSLILNVDKLIIHIQQQAEVSAIMDMLTY